MIYIITFFITSVMAYFVQDGSLHNRKYEVYFSIALTILIPSILGGIRSEFVGTDNIVYKAAFLKIAAMKSPIQAVSEGQFEVLYNLLCYIVSRFTIDYHWVCFVTELITVSFVVAGLYYFRNEIPIWLGILVYLFCQYCNVMNLVRQGIALSICFFALRFLREKKWIRYILWVTIAILFHTSAYISLLLLIIFKIMEGERSIWKTVLLIILSTVGVSIIPQMAKSLIGIGILPSKYLAYVSDSVSISWAHTIYRLPVLLIATFMYKKVVDKFDMYKYLYAMLWMEMIIVQVASIFDPAYRMSLYFSYAALVIIPSFQYGLKNDMGNKIIFYTLVVIYLVLYWIFFTVANGYGFRYPTYPFVSDVF